MKSNKSKGVRSFVKEKGYYIVLLLCAVAVGVSGYFLITDKGEDMPPENGTAPSMQQTEGTVPPTKDVLATEPTQADPAPTEAETVIVPPVSGSAVYQFSADALAYNTTTKDWRTHEGIDLSAAVGTKVAAVTDGTVHAIYEDPSFGMTVVLRHAGDYTTHYSNLSEEITLSVGDTVKAGDTVGVVGETALVETATEPHVHFAVYHNNIPVDPMEFLNQD